MARDPIPRKEQDMTLGRAARAGAIAATMLLAWFATAPQAQADDGSGRIVNLDTPATAAKGELSPHFDVRFMDSPESITYTSLSFRYGLASNIELGARGTMGAKRALLLPGGGSILFGGSDVELYGKYGFGTMSGVRLGAMGGVSFPNTPAQNQATGTVGGMASIDLGRRFTATLNPRAVFLDSNNIIGIGVGGSYHASEKVHILADWTGIVSGDNTRDTTTGARKRRDVWGAAVRYASPSGDQQIELDLGYGNAIGTTTGFGLTPGLGDSAGFFFALRVRR
jgi:hypothetical protein